MTLAPDGTPQDVQIDDGPWPGLPPKQSVWPKVIGIISTIWGGLGLVCLPVNIFMALRMQVPQANNPVTFPDWYMQFQTVGYVAGALFSTLLLAAGITLLQRKAVGRTLHLVYAIVSTAWLCLVTPILIVAFGQAKMDPRFQGMMTCVMILVMVLGLVYPVFLLVWFLRRKIREEVQSWRYGGEGAS